MKNLEYTTTTETISIKIDFNIKNLFKSNFKTAKWDNYNKIWTLNNSTRTINKLTKWLEEVSEVAKELEIAEATAQEIEFSEKELVELKREINKMKEDIVSLQNSKEELAEVNNDIENSKVKIEALKVELAEAQAEKDNEAKSVEEFVDSLIDTSKLENISDTISSYASKAFLRATEKDDLREELRYTHEAVKILEKAGYVSRNVSRLSNTTLSRLDRDNFEFSSEDFYDIEKIED